MMPTCPFIFIIDEFSWTSSSEADNKQLQNLAIHRKRLPHVLHIIEALIGKKGKQLVDWSSLTLQ